MSASPSLCLCVRLFQSASGAASLDVYVNPAQHPRMTAFDDWRARSPYYDETHEALAQSVRRFVTREIAPHIDRWEAEGELPRELHRKAAEAGILGLRYPEQYGGHSEGFDNFHSLVLTEELAAVGAGGLGASLMTHGIGLPPILGYVFVGLALGPHAFGMVAESQSTHLLADIGVVFLLFTLGLEFSWPRMVAMLE